MSWERFGLEREEMILVGPCAEEANCVEKNMFFNNSGAVLERRRRKLLRCGFGVQSGDVLRFSLRGTYMFKTALGRTCVEEGGK